MESISAVAALGALAHEGRLQVFRLLVQAGPSGLAAGEVARTLGMRPNTLSSNLGILSAAGLVTAQRQGRSIVYRAGFERMRELLAFLLEDCCAGDAAVCGPLAEIISRPCAAQARSC